MVLDKGLVMRILLQFPEGLKQKAIEHAKRYEKEGHEVFLSASACYGACDLALDEAKAINADKIIHFGHAPFIRKNLDVEVEYIEFRLDADLVKFEEAIKSVKEKTIVLATTVQHIHQLEQMKLILERSGKKVLIGKGALAAYPGQVLGCDSSAVTNVAKEADAIIFVGDGNFHALAIDGEIKKPVFVIQPKTGNMRQINDEIERLRKRRRGAIIAAVDAKNFGIILSTKPGQLHLALAQKMKADLEKNNKQAEILVGNEISPLALNNFMSFDCYIISACPRIADDSEMFGKPTLNAGMFAELMRIMKGMKA